MMKGGGGGYFYGRRTKQLSLFFIGVVCATIVVWSWEKTPLISTLLPSRDQALNLFPAGEVKEKQVTQSKDDLREAERVVDLVPPLRSTNTSSLKTREDEYSTTAQEKHHENTTSVVEKSTSSEESEGNSDSKPPKQQLVEPMTPEKLDSVMGGEGVGAPIANVEKQENTKSVVEKSVSKKESEEYSDSKPPKQQLVEPTTPKKLDSMVGEGVGAPMTNVEKQENSTSVEKSVSSEESEGYSDSKPPKQQLAEPMAAEKLDSVVRGEGISVPMANVEKKVCNFGKGRWVTDDSRPLYSGSGCKQWLSGMWACRLTQRTDFRYEKLKWQPNNCKMDNFTGSEFLKRMQDKTLAFVGDSLGRQQFQSLMCMITGGEERHDVEDIGKEYGLVKARGSVRPDGWAYRFQSSNTTILYYWSASLCNLEPIDPTDRNTDFAMHLDRPPAFLQRFLDRFHVLVLNTGHHWNRGKISGNRWVMYVGGKRNTDRRIAEIGVAKNLTIYSIVKWVNGELPKHPRLKAFFRSISPRHFFNGDWNSGGTCDSTTPGALEVVQEESSDPIASGAVKGTDVKLLDITALSEVRDEGHISRYSIRGTPGTQDCLHWCLPGIPDTWNEVLFAQI